MVILVVHLVFVKYCRCPTRRTTASPKSLVLINRFMFHTRISSMLGYFLMRWLLDDASVQNPRDFHTGHTFKNNMHHPTKPGDFNLSPFARVSAESCSWALGIDWLKYTISSIFRGKSRGWLHGACIIPDIHFVKQHK